jgi:hypothetical protein
MEKFAERFCNDNPGTFRTAEGAYLLAFAMIMLNTDAHNPMAERRLGKSDFVAMNYQQVRRARGGGRRRELSSQSARHQHRHWHCKQLAPPPLPLLWLPALQLCLPWHQARLLSLLLTPPPAAPAPPPHTHTPYPAQDEGGEMAPVTPVEQLEAIYERIVAQEIVMRDAGGSVQGTGAKSQGQSRALKLAAAIGFTHLAQPFRWGRTGVGVGGQGALWAADMPAGRRRPLRPSLGAGDAAGRQARQELV